ncbi:MAG: AAA family ATPase [Oscillochloridaceae bacterium umkhey_bin13]
MSTLHAISDVRDRLAGQQYIASDAISTALFLADKLGKPLLAEGPAGVGKTELAKSWAAATGRTLIRLQCYEGLDETKALYEWEYAKQLLYTQLLREKLSDLLGDATTLRDAADRLANEEDVFFSERFLLPRPLLKAITSEQPVVLLIDEIDRADAEFEAFLLEVLSDFQVSIPELGTLVAKHRPTVLLTSNNTRELSEALKRRCLYIHIDYPDLESELRVVQLKVPDLAPKLARQAVEMVQRLRGLDLKKHPSVSETLDWARALVELNSRQLDKQTLDTTLNVLLKYESDLQRASRELQRPERPERGERGERPDRPDRPDRPPRGGGYRGGGGGGEWNN